MNQLLSIITPFYCSNENSYLNNRIDFYIEKSFNPDWVERIIVDFGSPKKISKRVEKLCFENSFKYIYLDKGREKFSAGKCRNIGAQIASGKYISFSDVDLLADEKFYQEIFNKINKDNVFNYFEILPCFYLTEDGSKKYISGELSHEEIYDCYVEDDKNIIKMAAPATSCFLMRKDFYLSEGGMRDDFFGHGFEDFELMNRLAIKANKFYRSHDYYSHDHKYDSLEYKGYRTFFSIFGRDNLNKGLYYVHIYHEPAKDPGYKESSRRNRRIFEDSMLNFDKKKDSPPALDDLTIDRNVLMLGWKNGIPFKGIREVIPLLGRTFYRSESDFKNRDIFLEYIQENKIEHVFFLNPFGNDSRLEFFNVCNQNKINVIIYDRGALPDSWFFDTKGFNAGSSSYDPAEWNKDISEEDEFETDKYITNLCTSDKTLEFNGERIGSHALRNKYGVGDKKILFVPLQRPNDSVIRHFSGSVSGIEDFIEKVRALSARLPSDWRILIKQHPLESYSLDMPGCVMVDKSSHVNDLIEASNAILLINSGVGLLSLCFGKPVFCLGQSFYASSGLATRISAGEEIYNYVLNYTKFIPSRVCVNRFINYLVRDFYSFAKTEYVTVSDSDSGASCSVAVNLQFSSIRIKDIVNKKIDRRWKMFSTATPSYDYYRAYFQARAKTSGSGSASLCASKSVENPSVPTATKALASPITKVETAINSRTVPFKADIKNSQVDTRLVKSDSSFQKKFRKLLRDPALFIKDAIK